MPSLRESLLDRLAPHFEPGFFVDIECGDGWLPLINDMVSEFERIDPNFVVAQIKEKFGGLRVYVTSAPHDAFNATIELAEQQASHTCERCGGEGQLRSDLGWIQVLCEEHYHEARVSA